MNRRERLEAKMLKREEWAEGRKAKASSAYAKFTRIADNIPFGQPVLVGHHSEKHHRADIARMDSALRTSYESQQMAAHHEQKAAGLARQLETCIFSDDDDAPEALTARIAALEAKRERMKASNAAFRKGNAVWAVVLGVTPEQAAAARVRIMEGYSWCRQPHPTYELSNLGANITRLKKRLIEVTARRERAEKAQAAGVLIEGTGDYVRVTFADKPEREILDALRAAGFRWGGGSWCGPRAGLPPDVVEAANRSARA